MTSSPIKLDLGQLSVESSFMSYSFSWQPAESVLTQDLALWFLRLTKAERSLPKKQRNTSCRLISHQHTMLISLLETLKPCHGLDFTTKQAWVQIARKTAKAPSRHHCGRPRASSHMCRTCIFLYAKQCDNSTPISVSLHDPSLWFLQLYMERFQPGSSLGLIHAQMTTRTILFWILKMISTCLAFHLK